MDVENSNASGSFLSGSATSNSTQSVMPNSSDISRKKIETLIKTNDKRVELYINSKASSAVRTSMRMVKSDSQKQDCVYCLQCKTVLHGTAQGTSNLNRHLKVCKSSAKIEAPKIKSMLGGKKIPDKLKEKVAMDQVAYLARDLRPLSSCEQPGFLKIAQSLIDVGASLGSVKAEEVLTKRGTLTRRVLPQLYSHMKLKLVGCKRINILNGWKYCRKETNKAQGRKCWSTHVRSLHAALVWIT